MNVVSTAKESKKSVNSTLSGGGFGGSYAVSGAGNTIATSSSVAAAPANAAPGTNGPATFDDRTPLYLCTNLPDTVYALYFLVFKCLHAFALLKEK